MASTYRAVVPLKSLELAKTRLQGTLPPVILHGLVLAMARDMLAVLADSALVRDVTVIAGDEAVARLLAQEGVSCITDAELAVEGLNALLRAVLERLPGDAGESILYLHADLPLLSGEDIAAVAAAQPVGGVLIGADRQREGTNLMAFARARVPPLAFGPHSLASHRAACERAGIAYTVLERPGIALDIDSPADLATLAAMLAGGEFGDTHTARVLASANTAAGAAGATIG